MARQLPQDVLSALPLSPLFDAVWSEQIVAALTVLCVTTFDK